MTQIPRTFSTWAAGLIEADKPSYKGSRKNVEDQERPQADMSWELRTETPGPAHDEHVNADQEELHLAHARQVSHYKTLLIRAQSASSSSLHEALTKLHDLERRYADLQAEHAKCDEIRASRDLERTVAGVISRGDDLAHVMKGLSKRERVRILGVIAEACDPSDVATQIETLERYRRSRIDILSRVPGKIAGQILSELDLGDIMTLRLVSSQHLSLTRSDTVWRKLCLGLGHVREATESQLGASDRTSLGYWEHKYRDLLKRERNWRHGLAQNVVVLAEHDGSVTCLKLHDQTLISGSTDGTIRIWQIPPAPTKPDRIPPPIVISTKSVSCLDYRPTKDTIAAGFHDIGRVQLWRQQPSGWVASQTLSGHSHGIRVIAYLVSAGADKVLLVWDYETGERLAKFAQQPNLCAGLHLVHDNVISISIDGVVRTFDIGKKEMIKQCRIADLAKGCLIEEAKEVVSEIGDGVGKGTIKWVSGTGSILTLATKIATIRISWDEVAETDKDRGIARDVARHATNFSTCTPIKASGKISNPTTPLSAGRLPLRQGTISAGLGSPVAKLGTPVKALGQTSKTTTPISDHTPSRQKTVSIGPRLSATPSLHLSNPRARRQASLGPISPSSPLSSITKSTSSTAITSIPSGSPAKVDLAKNTGKVRVVPDITRLPRIIDIRKTPEVERGVFDSTSSRLVTSTRFTTRPGSWKEIYVSQSQGAMVPITGAWCDLSERYGLATPGKNPICMVIDADKLIYGCSDGLIVIVSFS